MNNKHINSLILDFIYKFFYILKAAANGNIVKYIGGNKFEFNSKLHTNKYSQSLPSFILKK